MPEASTRGQLLVTGVHEDGIYLCEERPTPFDLKLIDTHSPAFKVLTLRMCVPTREAEELHNALSEGFVEICIENIPSMVRS